MDVGVVGKVVAKGVNAQDDSCFPFRNSCRGGETFGEGIGYDAAEHGEALGVPAENISQNARNGEDPVPVRYGETDFGGDGLCGINGAALMAGRADTALLAGKGKQVFMVTMAATHPQETVGEITAA